MLKIPATLTLQCASVDVIISLTSDILAYYTLVSLSRCCLAKSNQQDLYFLTDTCKYKYYCKFFLALFSYVILADSCFYVGWSDVIPTDNSWFSVSRQSKQIEIKIKAVQQIKSRFWEKKKGKYANPLA